MAFLRNLSKSKIDQNEGVKSRLNAVDRSFAMIEFDLDGTICTANENFLSVMGYRLEEVVGQHHRIFVDPAEAASPGYAEMWQNLRAGQFTASQFKRLGKGGKEVWIQASYNPILDSEGKPIGVIKFATDITEQKSAATDAAGQMAAISRSQAVIEFTVDGTILTANDNFLGAMGYRLDEIRSQHHRTFVDPEYAASQAYQDFWASLARGEFQAGEYRRVGKGGKEVWIQATYNPVFDDHGKPIKVVKFATDITAFKHAINALGSGLQQLAEGNLRASIDTEFPSELDTLREAFNCSLEQFKDLVHQIRSAVGEVDTAAREIASGTGDLSNRTEKAAANIEETAASTEEMTATVKQNAENANDANQLADDANRTAIRGGEVVEQAVTAMSGIEGSAQKITDIIGVIDEIAFQTNLLALNASVEAARAGEAGKGFAVVAQEVRQLAQRSAQAASDIKALIQNSNGQVKNGVDLVNRAGEALNEIVGSIGKVAGIVQEISSASQEQASGVQEINQSITSMDEMTQQNSALVEQSTASARVLSDQAGRLNELMDFFKLDAADETPRRAPAPKPVAEVRPRQPVPAAVDDDGWGEF